MMMLADVPPAIECPAPLPSRMIAVWGDDAALGAFRAPLLAKGWKSADMIGETGPVVVFGPPNGMADTALCALIADVNLGKYGKLNAALAGGGN